MPLKFSPFVTVKLRREAASAIGNVVLPEAINYINQLPLDEQPGAAVERLSLVTTLDEATQAIRRSLK